MKPLKVSLPAPEHSHYDESTHRFVTHTHPHAGPHKHVVINGHVATKNVPGNYSPKAAR